MTAGGICEASTEAHHLCTHQQGRRQIPAESVHTQPAAHFRPAGLSIVDATVAKRRSLVYVRIHSMHLSSLSSLELLRRTKNKLGPAWNSSVRVVREKTKMCCSVSFYGPLGCQRTNNRGKSSSSRASCTFCLRQSVPFFDTEEKNWL